MSELKPMTRERALVIFDELVAACETGAMDGMFPPGGIPDARKFFADHSARVAELEQRIEVRDHCLKEWVELTDFVQERFSAANRDDAIFSMAGRHRAEVMRVIIEQAEQAKDRAERRLAAAQARIDELMLEYCPDEITAEQLETWMGAQVPVSEQPLPPEKPA